MFSGLALLVACAPGPPDEDETGATQLQNGSFTAELNGFNIHYEVHGQGPVLMTVPNSWGLTLEGLRALYRPLEDHLTLVYFDPRGMGQSDPILEEADMGTAAVRADFDALRQHLGLAQVNAIGWSNGAMNLILLAAEYPEAIDRAIFLHGVATFGEEDMQRLQREHPEWMQAYMALEQELASVELSAEEQNARLKQFNLELGFPPMFADPDEGRRILQEIYAETEFSLAHSRYSQTEMPVFDGRDKLPSILAPSLVLAGARDLLPVDRAREIHEGIPASEFRVFENSGHFAPLEEPEAFQQAVLEFLDAGTPAA